MRDIVDLISDLGIADCWRFCLCLLIAGATFWFLAPSSPETSHKVLAVCIFGPAAILGICWEYAAYQGRRR